MNNIMQRAAAMRAANPKRFKSWKDFVKAAAKNVPISQKLRNAPGLQKARNLSSISGVKKKKQTGTSNRAVDKRIQAKPVGKRKASPAAKKPYYYESRANRSDKGVLLGIGAVAKDLKAKYNNCLDLIAETKGTIAVLTEKYKNSKPKNRLILIKLKKHKKDLAEMQKMKLKLSKFK